MADEAANQDVFFELFGSSPCTNTEANDEVSNASYHSFNQMEEEEEAEQDEISEEAAVDQKQMEEEEDAEYVFGADSMVDEMLEHGPRPGMLFQSEDDLFQSYKAYAKSKGFGIVRRNRSAGSKYISIRCEKSGESQSKSFSKRMGCDARINAIRKGGDVWMMGKVLNDHNHELAPDMSEFMPAHRHLSNSLKRELEAHDRAGQRLSKTIRLMQTKAGGSSNLGATTKDCRNFVHENRRLRLGEGDDVSIIKFFKTLQKKNKDFFYLVDVDDECRLQNVMWIHPRSRAAYEEFHDVVSFDTTYLVNQYNMPFGSVVGVNHHHHSMLLGCCLLANETAATFKWFFQNWVEAMGGVMPTAILTDQDKSIRIALSEVMPETIHRFCIWHIIKKAGNKFAGVEDLVTAKAEFYSMVKESCSISEFESRWVAFKVKHGLNNHKWLKKLYRDKESWVPIYSNHIFWAGMSSTQRSESMHAFFDHYITYMSTLKTFVEQYELAVTDKFEKERMAQHLSNWRPIVCISNFNWERQFSYVYTNNIMQLIQDEIKKVWNCNLTMLPPDDVAVESYEIFERGNLNAWYDKEYTYVVEYRPTGQYIQCNCRKFESKGIFCCHILKVLVHLDIDVVNERYILRRWRKDVYRPYFSVSFAGGYPVMSKEYERYQEMEKEFHYCGDLAIDSSDKINFVKKKLREIRSHLKRWNPLTSLSTHANDASESESEDDVHILDPNFIRGKGRPRENRMKHPSEKKSRGTKTGGKGTTSKGQGTISRGKGTTPRGRGTTSRGRGAKNSLGTALAKNSLS